MSVDQVQVVVIDVADLAIELEGEDFYTKPVVYTFGGGKREFRDAGEDSNLYNPPPPE